MKLKELDSCCCCLGGNKNNNRTKRTQNHTLGLHTVFILQRTWECKMVVYFYFIYSVLRLPNPGYFCTCHHWDSCKIFVLQHDSGMECTPGESKNLGQKENGNYIMYARATSGDKLNNNKFSICSIRNISQVLDKKRNNCFVGMYLILLKAK